MSIRQGSTIIAGSSGSGGTSNYNNLENKPSINGIALEGNKTTEDLNINSLPDQTGNEGKVLITNGTEASWQTLPETGLPLFAHIWSDHLLTNTSYLRADTFSWQDGNIYYTAYNELVNEKNLTTETSTDTINDITIIYYRTPKGYKIVLPDMADTIAQLYENTGTAWYYILDTDNTRFKLPRNSRYESGTTTNNAGDFSAKTLANSTNNETNLNHITQFLYFYVGNTVQNETTIDVAAITEALNKKADRDLNNLTEDATNAVKPSDITNCITKIPQDIKLELNDGTLTLKAGSKVYNGDGTSVSIDSDLTVITNNFTGICFIRLQGNRLFADWNISTFSSGTDSTGFSGWYFNTNDKTLANYVNGVKTPNTDCTLPLGIVTVSNGAVTSIDQVFNGFGYIGSTIFALPGVEGLIPNGRNTDGSLNNIKWKTTNVSTFTLTNIVTNFVIYEGGYILPRTYAGDNLDPSSTPPYLPYTCFLDSNNNKFYYNQAGKWVDDENLFTICGDMTTDSTGRITSFSPKNVFQAVDRNDSEWASTASKPSLKRMELQLQATGTQYTAPANGMFHINKNGDANQFINLVNLTKGYGVTNLTSASPFGLITTLVASKGDVVQIDYNLNGATNSFNFIYDEGSK